MAVYPGAMAPFTPHRDSDLADLAMAGHMNYLQDEVVALQRAIGVDPCRGVGTLSRRLEIIAHQDIFEDGTGCVTEGKIPYHGLFRVYVTWAKIHGVSTARPEIPRGFYLYADGVEFAGRYIPDNGPTTYRRLANTYDKPVLHPEHHVVRLEEGTFVTLIGVIVLEGCVWEPRLHVQRMAV